MGVAVARLWYGFAVKEMGSKRFKIPGRWKKEGATIGNYLQLVATICNSEGSTGGLAAERGNFLLASLDLT